MKTAQQTQHTPGPWRATCPPVCAARLRYIEGEDYILAEIPDSVKMSQGEGLANARLIAAAPELLEALKIGIDCHDSNAAITGKYKGSQQLCQCRFCIAARAAIAKAQGH